MTVGSGLYIAPTEKDTIVQNNVMRQLLEGRSNAVGLVTLSGNGSDTTTTVTAPNCGPNSIVLMFPQTAHAAAVVATTCVLAANITPRQFIVTHATTSNADVTFMWVCLG